MSNLGCCTSGSRVGFPLTLMFVSTVELGWRARWTLWGSTTTNATTVLFGSVEARSVCRPQLFKGRRYRALNPWSEQDGTLLETISRGEFAINGLRNRDLQKLLYPGEQTVAGSLPPY